MARIVRKSKSRNVSRKKIKNEFQDRLGGRCQICSYSKCQNALHFHHKDAAQKKFTISDAVKRRSFSQEEITEEIKKCVLVCANCHAEIHAGLIEI